MRSAYDVLWDERAAYIERREELETQLALVKATIREYDKLIKAMEAKGLNR